MKFTIGYIPYSNMIPFHQGFGPEAMKIAGHEAIFNVCSPHALGLAAEKRAIDAGAMSLVDCFRLSNEFEPIGNFGIGVKRAAQSVLFFSKGPISQFRGLCAVTDETSTSVCLLQALLEKRYNVRGVTFGRIASSMLYDGSADGLLLIGDEALRARQEGIRGLPVVTDLGEEWFQWKRMPFAFARWVVRRTLPKEVKEELERILERSLESTDIKISNHGYVSQNGKSKLADDFTAYWDAFAFSLTEAHLKSITLFEEMIASHV